MKVPYKHPGREKQKMVVVDFSNPFLRDYFPRWLREHEQELDAIRANLAGWIQKYGALEKEEARRAGREPRPLAVVFDVDEVLLCNTHLNGYQAPGLDFHAADFFTDPATGLPWGRDDPGDPPLPGATRLIEYIATLDVRPFFITGRLESIRGVTVEDFRRAGFLADPTAGGLPLTNLATRGRALPPGAVTEADLGNGTLVMCPDDQYPPAGASIRPWKEGERKKIEQDYRIILNVGDQPSDLGLHGDVQVYMPHPFYSTY